MRYVDNLAYDALLTENLPNDDLLGELIADRLFYYPIVSREPFRNEGRLTDAIDTTGCSRISICRRWTRNTIGP